MSLSPEALRAIREVAEHLGDLRDQVVFIGGVVRGLLITDPAVEGSRATKDVDIVTAGIATRAEYYARIHARLRALGFKEDTSEGAPLCRWKLGAVVLDALPPVSEVLGFSNRWYLRAIETAVDSVLPDTVHEPTVIRLITAPCFLATKLEAFGGRGDEDYEGSHDLEDIIALIDGRPTLLEEVEREPDELRQYISDQLSAHLSRGLSQAVPGHLAGDAGSQARVPRVRCILDRLRRRPQLMTLGQAVESSTGTGTCRIEVTSIERQQASPARDHVIVLARVTNSAPQDRVVVESDRGIRFSPDPKLSAHERVEHRWVYEVPREAQSLRLLLPFGGYELPLE